LRTERAKHKLSDRRITSALLQQSCGSNSTHMYVFLYKLMLSTCQVDNGWQLGSRHVCRAVPD